MLPISPRPFVEGSALAASREQASWQAEGRPELDACKITLPFRGRARLRAAVRGGPDHPLIRSNVLQLVQEAR